MSAARRAPATTTDATTTDAVTAADQHRRLPHPTPRTPAARP
ncbi:hypothetical protein [Actinokineospora bangkokensis]|nr:hypothetical protein [Actinokineospora bangkokensis]